MESDLPDKKVSRFLLHYREVLLNERFNIDLTLARYISLPPWLYNKFVHKKSRQILGGY